MEFKDKRPIFIQIAEMCSEKILLGEWKEGERIPSIRQFAAEMEVNPNTLVRSYGYLQDMGVIENKRGMGFIVTNDARKTILTFQRKLFVSEVLPTFFKQMDLVEIDMKELENCYDKYKSGELVSYEIDNEKKK